ncbi:MAG: transposase [Thioploca sp.]|nr:transposase [Thioploca sp.]
MVYVDESGFAHDRPRRHGYSPVGQRCFGQLDWGAKGRTNVIGALLSGLLLTVTLLTSNVNSEVFYTWITQELLPQLPNQGVVVMDKASFHKRLDIQKAIRDAGHILLFLPPYSPQQKHCSISDIFTLYEI